LSASTKRYYAEGWKRIESTALISKRLNDIGPADVSVLKFALEDGEEASGSTANQAIRTLSRMLSFAAEKDYLKAVPRFSYRSEQRREAVIDDQLEKQILAHASETLYAFLVVMFDCGMRPSEVHRMRWEHILWADAAIRVPYGKTLAATRYVPLSERMAEALRARRAIQGSQLSPSMRDEKRRVDPTAMPSEKGADYAQQPETVGRCQRRNVGANPRMGTPADSAGYPESLESGVSSRNRLEPTAADIPHGGAHHAEHAQWVFPTEKQGKKASKDGLVSIGAVSQSFRDALLQCEGPIPSGLSLYSVRHTFATRFLKWSNGDRAALKAIMGHASLAMQDRYVHGQTAGAAEIVNRMNEERYKVVTFGRRA
jgi:integrase